MLKRTLLPLWGVALLAVLTASPEPLQARKQYMDAFSARYPRLVPQVTAQKCGVCHGKTKVLRSDYAESMKAALGAKNVKKQADIDAALKQVEVQQHQPGQSYKDLFDAGMLPPPYVPPEETEGQ